MNLYLRLFRLIVGYLFSRTPEPDLRASTLFFRVWPWDCDINLHLTNSRYLSFMDLGRTDLIHRCGLLPLLLKRRWLPVAQATHLTFIRAINPFQRFTLDTELIYWDSRYWYIRQTFRVGERTAAIGLIRGVFIERGGQVLPLQRLFEVAGVDVPPPELPPVIEQWQTLLQTQRSTQPA